MTRKMYVRQQARADKRAIFKQLLSARKAEAMQRRAPGGAAAVARRIVR